MKYYHNSPLLYEKGFSIIINDEALSFDSSICYYFDYDERSHSVNMDFPHFHSFYEMMIPLSPKAYHFINGKRYDLVPNDLVLLRRNILRDRPAIESSSASCFPDICLPLKADIGKYCLCLIVPARFSGFIEMNRLFYFPG